MSHLRVCNEEAEELREQKDMGQKHSDANAPAVMTTLDLASRMRSERASAEKPPNCR